MVPLWFQEVFGSIHRGILWGSWRHGKLPRNQCFPISEFSPFFNLRTICLKNFPHPISIQFKSPISKSCSHFSVMFPWNSHHHPYGTRPALSFSAPARRWRSPSVATWRPSPCAPPTARWTPGCPLHLGQWNGRAVRKALPWRCQLVGKPIDILGKYRKIIYIYIDNSLVRYR